MCLHLIQFFGINWIREHYQLLLYLFLTHRGQNIIAAKNSMATQLVFTGEQVGEETIAQTLERTVTVRYGIQTRTVQQSINTFINVPTRTYQLNSKHRHNKQKKI